jgi:hypothetical protein
MVTGYRLVVVGSHAFGGSVIFLVSAAEEYAVRHRISQTAEQLHYAGAPVVCWPCHDQMKRNYQMQLASTMPLIDGELAIDGRNTNQLTID